MSKYYEIVSLCDAMPNEVHKYLIPLNKKENIKHKLFRYHLDKVKIYIFSQNQYQGKI